MRGTWGAVSFGTADRFLLLSGIHQTFPAFAAEITISTFARPYNLNILALSDNLHPSFISRRIKAANTASIVPRSPSAVERPSFSWEHASGNGY
jgi:hypothetical protein